MKLISLNIEGRRHLRQRVLPFLKQENSQVICLQEVFEIDVPILEKELKMQGFFIPLSDVTSQTIHQDPLGIMGNLILSSLPVLEKQVFYYAGSETQLPIFFQNDNPNSFNRALSLAKIALGSQELTIITTHFTWSAKGAFTALQKEHYQKLSRELKKLDSFVLCGDFNSPRGSGGVFDLLAGKYQDNIPPEIKTTVYGPFHKSKKDLQLVVDGLFSTPDYQISKVRVEGGVSDHYAIVAQVERI